MRAPVLFMACFVALHIAAEKSRQLVGEEASSKSSTERFTFLNCFDMKFGTMACVVKECVKLYFYYIRAVHVRKIRTAATEVALREKLSQGRNIEEAMKGAQRSGEAAARRASRQAKHIMGPVVSSGWDFFEAIYVGGSMAEGLLRGLGTFVGAYAGGITGEVKLGWLGFVLGSQIGSWVGARTGLMAYDVWNGVRFLLHLVDKESISYLGPPKG